MTFSAQNKGKFVIKACVVVFDKQYYKTIRDIGIVDSLEVAKKVADNFKGKYDHNHCQVNVYEIGDNIANCVYYTGSTMFVAQPYGKHYSETLKRYH